MHNLIHQNAFKFSSLCWSLMMHNFLTRFNFKIKTEIERERERENTLP